MTPGWALVAVTASMLLLFFFCEAAKVYLEPDQLTTIYGVLVTISKQFNDEIQFLLRNVRVMLV